MNRLGSSFVAVVAGISIAVVVAVFVIGPIGSSPSSAELREPQKPRYVSHVGSHTASLLEGDYLSEFLDIVPTTAADDIRGQVFREDADGLILDDETIVVLPENVVSNLYASGRVIVVFDVPRQDVLIAARSSEAFPDADQRFIPDVTLNPGPAVQSLESPFFSVVYRSRPGTGNVSGGETTQAYNEGLFVGLLTERAQNARGIFDVPESEEDR